MGNQEKPKKLLHIHKNDNVVIVVTSIHPGDCEVIDGQNITFAQEIGIGHKVAAKHIKAGEKVYKCGVPIGSAKEEIRLGAHIHLHNLKSDYISTYTRDSDHAFAK
jgi:hypothetical protein